ncbi:DUF6587 family protein [Dokdonella sp. MW10]|uniref:DUF6587 family protein n=1 Tax=Dokdonella sp. MW10 TaxID=2992926 RepID=UPI003F7DFA13
MNAFLDIAVVGLIVAWAALFALRRLMPRTWRRGLAACANLLDAPTRPAAMRRAGAWLRPVSVTGGSCGDGCSTCGSCGPAPATAPRDEDAKPLVFDRHPRSGAGH